MLILFINRDFFCPKNLGYRKSKYKSETFILVKYNQADYIIN